jgi:GTPase SAR1 family protein
MHSVTARRKAPREAPLVPRRDIKLIVLGNSNAGKTNLVNYLIKGTFDGARRSTHGLEVHRWLPEGKRFPELKDVAVSIWDFGGQEYYHGTYRLFLSANAVYVLLWCKESNLNGRQPPSDDKKKPDQTEADLEHFEIQYWLDTIRHYSRGKLNGKLIAVQNKTDDPDRDKQRIDQHLHDAYGINDSFHISLREGTKKKKGRQYGILQHFLDELAIAMASSEDEAKIPEAWRRIRDEILALKEPGKMPNLFAGYLQHDLWINLKDFNDACATLMGAYYFRRRRPHPAPLAGPRRGGGFFPGHSRLAGPAFPAA